METVEWSNWLFDNLRNLFFPEDWIQIDRELSKIELLAILTVERHGEITMSKLAESMNVPMSTATGIADRLVRNDYLVRGRSEADRRIVAIMAAPKAKAVLAKVKSIVADYLELIRAELSEEEERQIMAIAVKVLSALRKAGTKSATGGQSADAGDKFTRHIAID